MARAFATRFAAFGLGLVAISAAARAAPAPDDPRLEPGSIAHPPADPSGPHDDSVPSAPEPARPTADDDVGADSIYLFSGEFFQEVVDLRVKGRGVDFVWGRKYRSQAGPTTAMGVGWDFSLNVRLQASGANLVLWDGNSRRDAYFKQADGSWARDEFFREIRRNSDGSLTLRFADTSAWIFRPVDRGELRGRLDRIVDRNGNALRFEYDSKGRLAAIRDTLNIPGVDNRVVRVAYDANGYLASVTDWTGRQVRYTYYHDGDAGGSAGDLATATTPAVTGTPNGNDFPHGKTTTYTYSHGLSPQPLNHNLLTITDPSGQVRLTNVYSRSKGSGDLTFDHVVSQRRGGAADVLQLTYKTLTPSASNHFATGKTIANDRVGNVRELFYDARHRLVLDRQYTGRARNDEGTTDTNNRPKDKLRPTDPDFFETSYGWNDDSQLAEVVRPDGTTTSYVYQHDLDPASPRRSRGNLRERHDLPGAKGGDQTELVTRYEYDDGTSGGGGSNRVTTITDPRGNVSTYAYDALGNLVLVQDRIASVQHRYAYDSYGNLIQHVWPSNDAGGVGTHRDDRYTYHDGSDPIQNGYLREQIVDFGGANLTTRYAYDAVGNVLQITDPRGNATDYTYNQLDQLVRETSRPDSNGIRYRYDNAYDADDNVVEKVADGARTRFEYDNQHRVLRVLRDVDGTRDVVTESTYDGNGQRILEREGEATDGHDPTDRTRFQYDERGLPWRTTRGDGSSGQSTTQYDYDGDRNQTVESVDADGSPRVTRTIYDGFGRATRVTDAMGNVTTTSYDPSGNVISTRLDGEIDDQPGGAGNVPLSTTRFTYDAMDRRIQVDRGWFDPVAQTAYDDGASTTMTTWSDTSKPTQTTDDLGNVTRMVYDSADRPLQQIDARGNTTTLFYDADSSVIARTDTDLSDRGDAPRDYTTTFTYDGLDRRVTRTDGGGNTTRFAYDARGNLVSQIDARGIETRFTYDGLDRPTSTARDMDGDGASDSDPADATTRQSWDDSSRLATRTDANGNVTRFVYDSLDRRAARIEADGTSRTWQYDGHGNRVSVIDANGSVSRFTYDAIDRSTGRVVTPGAGVSSDTTFERFTYDGASQLRSAQDDDSAVTRTYDSLSGVTSETAQLLPGGPARTTQYGYDADQHVLSLTDPRGVTTSFAYDQLGRVTEIVEAASSRDIGRYEYVGRDRVEELDYSSGLRSVPSYDAARRVIETSHATSGGVDFDRRIYTYDANSNLTSESDALAIPTLTRSYSYDALNRLVTSDTQPGGPTVQYQYDAAGDRTSVTGGANPGSYTMDPSTPSPADRAMNQYTTTPFDARTYDANGNLAGSGRGTFTYDALDRLVRAAPGGGAPVTTYRYDALGRRVETNAGGQIARFYYDGVRPILEQDGADSTIVTYVWGAREHELIEQSRNGVLYECHGDVRDSVRLIADAAGNAIERYAYDDFGVPSHFDGSGSAIGGSAIGNPWLFEGRQLDGTTGFYHYDDSDLDPMAGRFITRQDELPAHLDAMPQFGSRVHPHLWSQAPLVLMKSIKSDDTTLTRAAEAPAEKSAPNLGSTREDE